LRDPSKSIELTKQGKHNEALELLNGAIAESLRFQERQPTCTLYHHTAVIARAGGNLSASSYHYQQSLPANLKIHLPYTF